MEPCGDLPSDVKPDLSETLQKLEETGNKTGNKPIETLAIPIIDEGVIESTVKNTPVTVNDVIPEKKETKNNETTKTGSAERVRENFLSMEKV